MGKRGQGAAMSRLRQKILEVFLAGKDKGRFRERHCAGWYLLFGVATIVYSYMSMIDPLTSGDPMYVTLHIPLLELVFVIGPLLLGIESLRSVMRHNHRRRNELCQQ